MRFFFLAVVIALAGSASAGERGESADHERRARLLTEINELIGVPHADALDQCRLMPFGSKPCGGPRWYLVYSTKVTDPDALRALVDEHRALDEKINAEEGAISDCAIATPPRLSLENGQCHPRRD